MEARTGIETEFLFTLKGDIGEPVSGNENLMIFEVLNASIEGPRVRGEIVAPMGDWIRIMPNGNWKLDVRFTIRTDDGEFVYCNYTGILRMDEGLGERIAAGESIDGDDMYFRSTPYFETTSKKYAWMNDIVCIGRMAAFGGGKASYEVFQVL
jgi:hypothetical protein